MNYKVIAKLIIRLIALSYFMKYFVMTISSVVAILEVMGQPGASSISLLSAFTPMFLMVIISILLWVYAEKIAGRLTKDVHSEVLGGNIDYEKVQIIVFGFAGILVICNSVPDILSTIYQINTLPNQPINIPDRIYSGYMANLIGSSIKFILGLWLILGSKGIINMIKKLRTAGINYEAHQDE